MKGCCISLKKNKERIGEDKSDTAAILSAICMAVVVRILLYMLIEWVKKHDKDSDLPTKSKRAIQTFQVLARRTEQQAAQTSNV